MMAVKIKQKKQQKKSKAIVLRHLVNLGKGAALKTGCDYAIKNKADVIIAIDADAQHDPKEIPNFLGKINKYNVVLAYRKLNKNMPFILKFGNWFINKTISFLYGVKMTPNRETKSE